MRKQFTLVTIVTILMFTLILQAEAAVRMGVLAKKAQLIIPVAIAFLLMVVSAIAFTV